VGFLCSVGRLRAYLGDFGAAHRPPTVKKKKILALEGRRAGTWWDPEALGWGDALPQVPI